MERLYSVRDICERYQVKSVTARKFMRDMVHMESPLMVSERALKAWEEYKTLPPESETRRMIRKGVKKRV
jgi:hypothetical protein